MAQQNEAEKTVEELQRDNNDLRDENYRLKDELQRLKAKFEETRQMCIDKFQAIMEHFKLEEQVLGELLYGRDPTAGRSSI